MYSYDEFLGKSQTYFGYAGRESPGDLPFGLFILLGMEFLLKCPLAKIHPSLVADPSGPSLLQACGVGNASNAKTIMTNTAIERLQTAIPAFKEISTDATFLANIRNAELHSSAATLASLDVVEWLPKFTRVAEVICDHLELNVSDIVGAPIIDHGRMLVDDEDRKMQREVHQRIAIAKSFVQRLTKEELAGRQLIVAAPIARPSELVDCPACGFNTAMSLELARVSNTRFAEEDGNLIHDVISVAVGFLCPVCHLTLSSTAEVRAAGLRQQYVHTENEHISDRYLVDYEPDYGND
jgi:hypothetical protein